MKYRRYIKNSTDVSAIGVGAWQFGHNSGWKSMSEKEAIDMVGYALDHGVNFFDTAPNYGLGTSEERLGPALQGVDRDRIVINTKFGHHVSGDTNFDAGLIRKSLEGSLRRLQMDHVDSLILHNPPAALLDGGQCDHYEVFERLIDEGKIKAYGASLDTAADMRLLMHTTRSQVIEAFFNILHQDTAQAFDLAVEQEVAIIVKIPLDSGWLSGKYSSESTFQDIRSRWSKADIRTRARLVERVKSILNATDDLAQKAIAFCSGYTAVSTVIPGNASIAQMQQNVDSIGQAMPEELIGRLEQFYREEVMPLSIPW